MRQEIGDKRYDFSLLNDGATRGNRTPKGCPTASLVLRVYQFRHGRIKIFLYFDNMQFVFQPFL